MYCKRCGKLIADGSSFCHNCGKETTITPVPLTPQLKVTLSSNHFKQLDEEITITIKLKEQLGESAINEAVTLENLDNGSLVNLTTDNYGNVTFVVSHTLKDINLYNIKSAVCR